MKNALIEGLNSKNRVIMLYMAFRTDQHIGSIWLAELFEDRNKDRCDKTYLALYPSSMEMLSIEELQIKETEARKSFNDVAKQQLGVLGLKTIKIKYAKTR